MTKFSVITLFDLRDQQNNIFYSNTDKIGKEKIESVFLYIKIPYLIPNTKDLPPSQ